MKKTILTVCALLLTLCTLTVAIVAAPAVSGRKTCTAYIADIRFDGKPD